MDEVAFHCEPPANIPTLVTAFTGWIDAGEAATDALRFLVRQLAAEPLATIDLEEFVDFTQDRPVVRLSAEGERRTVSMGHRGPPSRAFRKFVTSSQRVFQRENMI